MKYCYNKGTVESYNGSVAGIVGYGGDGNISYCYNIGNLIGRYEWSKCGIVNSDAVLEKCFYLEDTASSENDEQGRVESTPDQLNSFEEFLVWIKNK